MSKEKQIEEMARIITSANPLKTTCKGITCIGCEFQGKENCYRAVALYDAGYRKQSEPISCGHEKGVEWVKLPCKVGDILYVISQMKDKRILPFINEYEVTSISINRKSIVVYHEMDGYIKTFKQADFGKTVFLSKAEAERSVTDRNVGSK